MDEQLQAKIEEARNLGYSEEQIQAFLNQQAPAPAGTEPFQNRTEEAVGTAQYGAAEAAKYAALGGGGYYGLKKVAEALRGPVAPVAPAAATPAPTTPITPVQPAMEPGGQQLKDFVQQRGQYARPTVPGQPQVGMPQTAGIGKDIATDKIVRETALQRVLQGMRPYLPALRGMTAVGGMWPGSLNTGEAEQLAEYRRRTGQQP